MATVSLKPPSMTDTTGKSPSDTGVETGGAVGYAPDGSACALMAGAYNYKGNVPDHIGSDVDRTLGTQQVSQDAATQYAIDKNYLEQAYSNNTMDGTEYQARLDYLANIYAEGDYLTRRKGGTADVGYINGPTTGGTNYADWLAENTGSTSGGTIDDDNTGISDNGEATKYINPNAYISSHIGNGGRLLQFVHNDGSEDDDKIGYIKLLDNSAMAAVASGDNKQYLDAIYVELTSKYNKFIINNVQESRAERTSIAPTVGDSFAATFSGREPMVLTVSGLLICDHDRTKLTWYHAFMNAYEKYLRASMLARYRSRMKLVLPDFTDYTGYMLNVGVTMNADSDMVIPMHFSLLVCEEAFNKAYGLAPGATIANNDGTDDSILRQAGSIDNADPSSNLTGSKTVDANGNVTTTSSSGATTLATADAVSAAEEAVASSVTTAQIGTAKTPASVGASNMPSGTSTSGTAAQKASKSWLENTFNNAGAALTKAGGTYMQSQVAKSGILYTYSRGTTQIQELGARLGVASGKTAKTKAAVASAATKKASTK